VVRLGAVLFILVVSGFLFLDWFCHRGICRSRCMWADNSGFGLEGNIKYLNKGK
jgi:hypothetical protein